jgi:hypothetical protein
MDYELLIVKFDVNLLIYLSMILMNFVMSAFVDFEIMCGKLLCVS